MTKEIYENSVLYTFRKRIILYIVNNERRKFQ